MINIFLFLSIIFLLTFLIGRFTERIKVPWIFAALLIGAFLAVYNPFISVTSSETFNFLAQLGMYFLLFMIGFEIDLKKFKKTSKFILKSTIFIIFFEAIFGTLLVHFVFGYGWLISFIVALSFATVGEAILIPILDEFGIVNTKLGQSIIGIGTLDDAIELFTLILLILLLGSAMNSYLDVALIIASLFVLFFLAFGLTKFKNKTERFSFLNIEILFLLTLFIFFLFIGIGGYAHSAPIAALLAGLALKNFIPEKRLRMIESEIKTMCYGFFAPIFFLWVGLSMDINYLVVCPLLIFLVAAVSISAKILGSSIIARKRFGLKKSVLLGIGLSVRFSTSIIIIKILFDSGLIGTDLYSVIVASTVLFTFLIPVLFSNLLVRWKVARR